MFPCFKHSFNLAELVERESDSSRENPVDLGLCPLNAVNNMLLMLHFNPCKLCLFLQ